MSSGDSELDPRIQIELENLNTATDEINKLEIELEEANSTFRILLNESTRRLKLSSKKLGNCIEKARPYYESLEKAREAQIECQKAAVKFQRANEIHAAAKETVALAEQRFMSNSHEWQFDNAWQEMLNHATQKVMDAEKQKAECHAEHQKRTRIFNEAEKKVQLLEDRYRRSIAKSRPYFEEKQICQDQLQTQKNRIQELQSHIQNAKATYSTALRNLERISDDIHRQRGDYPPGPREPGVGAELNTPTSTTLPPLPDFKLELEKCDYPSLASSQMSLGASSQRSSDFLSHGRYGQENTTNSLATTMGGDSEIEEDDDDDDENTGEVERTKDYADSHELHGIIDENDVEALRQKVRILAVRPIEGGDGQQQETDIWEHELKATVDKLDHLLMMKEFAKRQQDLQTIKQKNQKSNQQQLLLPQRPNSILGAETTSPMVAASTKIPEMVQYPENILICKGPLIKVTSSAVTVNSSMPSTPEHGSSDLHLKPAPLKTLQKLEPLPSVNVSMRELPLLARLSHELVDRTAALTRQRRRSLD